LVKRRNFREITFFKRRILKKRGIYSNFPRRVSFDLVAEPPVSVGDATISKNCRIGRNSYICSGTLWDNVTIGRYCSIADNVLIGPPDHPTHYLSTWDSFYYNKEYYRNWIKGKLTVLGNDIWVGANVLIRKGVHIEDGAVVGAGAVVIENVPAYAIVGGIPAHILNYRFDRDTIASLLELQWWNLDDTELRQLPFDNVKKCISILTSKSSSSK